MRIQYEEKTYESYFNAELAQRGIFYFPPGQVQEGSIGADALVMNHSRWLWRRLGRPFWFRVPFEGTQYRAMAAEMEEFLQREITDIPDVRGNILFQYKRSQYMVKNTSEEWQKWNEPYFRYDIYSEQQQLLEHLHLKFSNSVLILYAAPAIQDVNQLVDLHKSKRIISNTNFRPAHELAAHRRNSFKEAGSHSWACSDPVMLESFNFEQRLSDFKFPDAGSAEATMAFSQQVQEVLLASNFVTSYRSLSALYRIDELQDTPLFKAHLIMASLRELTGIQWVKVKRGDAFTRIPPSVKPN